MSQSEGDFSTEREENGGGNVLLASELADGDAGGRSTIKGAKALRRSPSKDSAHHVALRKALTKDRHVSRCGRGRGGPKKGAVYPIVFSLPICMRNAPTRNHIVCTFLFCI